jgi:signal transduction histidine kinase
MIGRSVDAIVPPDRWREVLELIQPSVRSGEVLRNLETTRMKRDGSIFPALLTVSPIQDSAGNTVGISIIARDISEQKRAEESLRETQKLESLGLLAGGIAHDFNNLLTGITANASLLEEEFPAGSPLSQVVQTLSDAAQRMARLTSQMLAYSGRGQFVIDAVDLSKQVVQITSLIQASIPKNVEFRLALDNGLPLIEADLSQLQQIIMNLVINGAESVGAAQGAVELKTSVETVGENELRANVTRSSAVPGKYVVLTVEDTGCGMDEATRARIFDPFFTTKFTGRGLGLSSVMGIVRGHNGLLTVDSEPGVGSTFRVFFPESRVRMSPEPVVPQGGAAEGTVLVVDDEDVVRKVAQNVLRRLGYDVITAANGKAAVELFARNPSAIDVVLLDMTMPVMGGEEALKHLLEIKPGASVVAMSGFNEREAKQRLGNRIAGFVQKPFTPSQLGSKITAALQRERKTARL